VPPAVLKIKFVELSQVFIGILQKFAQSNHTTLTKSVGGLLHAVVDLNFFDNVFVQVPDVPVLAHKRAGQGAMAAERRPAFQDFQRVARVPQPSQPQSA
jgi:hypothetical protein